MAITNASRPAPSNPTGPLKGDPPPEIPRDQWGRAQVIPFSRWEGPDVWARPEGMTRASSLGGISEDQYGLNRWRTRVIMVGLVARPDLVLATQTCTLNAEDKDRLDKIADQAFEHAEGTSKSTIGTSLHHLADRIDRGQSVPDVGQYNPTVQAYQYVSEFFTFSAIEMFVVNEELDSAGTPDRVCELREGWYLTAPDGTVFGPGDRLIWDLKTSSTADYFGIKFCVQFSVYQGGRPYRHLGSRSIGRGKAIEVRGEYFDWPDGVTPSPDWGLVCHVPSGGDTAELHWVPLEAGRELAARANQTKADRKARWIVPAGLPVQGRPTGISWQGISENNLPDAQSLLSRVKAAHGEEEIIRLWENNQELWTEACTIAAAEKLKSPDSQAVVSDEREQILQTAKGDILAWIEQATEESHVTVLYEMAGEVWDSECGLAANAKIEEIRRKAPKEPEQVAHLALMAKIRNAENRTALDMIKHQYDNSEVWSPDCDRMVSAVLREMSRKL